MCSRSLEITGVKDIFDSWSCTPLSEIVNLGIFPCGLSFRFGSLEFPSCVKTLLN